MKCSQWNRLPILNTQHKTNLCLTRGFDHFFTKSNYFQTLFNVFSERKCGSMIQTPISLLT